MCRSRRREVGERKQKRARVDGKRKKTDPALIVFFSIISVLAAIRSGSLFGGERLSIVSIT